MANRFSVYNACYLVKTKHDLKHLSKKVIINGDACLSLSFNKCIPMSMCNSMVSITRPTAVRLMIS